MEIDNDLKKYLSKFTGVSIHGNSIRISFIYQEIRCLERIKSLPISKSNIKFAFNLRSKILHEIGTGTFDYATYFPHSNKAKKFSKKSNIPTVAKAISEWLLLSKSKDRPKTYANNLSRAKKYIIPKFGNCKLDEITRSEIINWREHEVLVSNKTKNEILIPFRGVFKSAHADRLIDFNPFDHIQNLKKNKKSNADPFTREEIRKISTLYNYNHSETNCFVFACWMGARISEYLALALEDIDYQRKRIHIQRAVVEGVYCQTKNDGSNRYVDLIDKAWDALIKQIEISQKLEPIEVEVLQEDNKTYKKEKLSFIFVNSNTLLPFTDSTEFSESYFTSCLKNLGIRHRGPGQTRHTYASQLLTAGINERWIANQMGHSSIAMLEKHYGKWMKEEIPDMAQKVSILLLK